MVKPFPYSHIVITLSLAPLSWCAPVPAPAPAPISPTLARGVIAALTFGYAGMIGYAIQHQQEKELVTISKNYRHSKLSI